MMHSTARFVSLLISSAALILAFEGAVYPQAASPGAGTAPASGAGAQPAAGASPAAMPQPAPSPTPQQHKHKHHRHHHKLPQIPAVPPPAMP